MLIAADCIMHLEKVFAVTANSEVKTARPSMSVISTLIVLSKSDETLKIISFLNGFAEAKVIAFLSGGGTKIFFALQKSGMP